MPTSLVNALSDFNMSEVITQLYQDAVYTTPSGEVIYLSLERDPLKGNTIVTRSYANADKFAASVQRGDSFLLPAQEGGIALFHLANENKRGLNYWGTRDSFLKVFQRAPVALTPSSPLCKERNSDPTDQAIFTPEPRVDHGPQGPNLHKRGGPEGESPHKRY